MTFKEKIEQFEAGNADAFGGQTSAFNSIYIDDQGFAELVEMLNHDREYFRFWALTLLIKNAASRLVENHESLKAKLFHLLFDEYIPCSDRAQWAMNILGLPGLEFMMQKYRKRDAPNLPALLTVIARHTEAPKKSTEILRFLTSALQHSDRDMRFAAVIGLMDASPLRAEHLGSTPLDTDYALIYSQVLPVAIELQQEGAHYEEWGARYAEMINSHNMA